MEKLIIFGGSFDPVHRGHLRIARAASIAKNADVVFVPAKEARWKHHEAKTRDRVNMLKIAIQEGGFSSFYVDECEINRPGNVTYTVDTIKYFHRKFPKKKLYFLLGADQVALFREWKDPEIIASLATPLCVSRTGVELNEEIIKEFAMEVLPFDKGGEVSSSDIRNLRSLDIHPGVLSYIEEHNLYYMSVLEETMNEKRLIHSLSVASLAYDIALCNRFPNPRKAYVAGLIHDIAKDLPEADLKHIVEGNYPEYKEFPDYSLHQFAAPYMAKALFGIDDAEIVEAIRFHCTGKAHLSPLGKVLYSADKIEPGRGYNSKPLIKACKKNYYAGFLKVLSANEEFLAEKGKTMDNPLSEECRFFYLGIEDIGEKHDRTRNRKKILGRKKSR